MQDFKVVFHYFDLLVKNQSDSRYHIGFADFLFEYS